MSRRSAYIDRPLLIITLLILGYGFFIFTSASLGLLARDGARFSSVMFNQVAFGLGLGGLACVIASYIPYTFWKKQAFWVFIGSFLITAAVFIPGVGMSHGGARRWIDLGPVSFQPSEFLKIGYIMFYAAWLAHTRKKITTFKGGILPFMAVTALAGLPIVLQPDNDTFVTMATAGGAMLFVSGARWRHILGIIATAIALFAILYAVHPYVRQRVDVFLHPDRDAQGAAYQVQQSLIAIGSGGITGKGFGQSVQKFHYLPEPIGDSIFAVAGEEFGFAGTLALVLLYALFAIRGYKVSLESRDPFALFLGVGIVTLVLVQSFMNMAAMLGLIPLSGLPLLFISHGGTAMLFTLFATGILFNVSRHSKKA